MNKSRLTDLSLFLEARVSKLTVEQSESVTQNGDTPVVAATAILTGEFEALDGTHVRIRFAEVERLSITGFTATTKIERTRSEVYYSSRTRLSRVKLYFDSDEFSLSFSCSALMVLEDPA